MRLVNEAVQNIHEITKALRTSGFHLEVKYFKLFPVDHLFNELFL
jgi:hypothetical protein